MNISFLFSILSICLGFIAALIPVISVLLSKRVPGFREHRGAVVLSSMLLCAASITIQVCDIRSAVLVRKDFSAIEDTIGVLSLICVALLCIVTLLNALFLLYSRRYSA